MNNPTTHQHGDDWYTNKECPHMDKYRWIIESTIEAWLAQETYMVLPGTVFVNEPDGPRGAFLRYADGILTIDNYPVDVGDYLPQFLGIIDAVKETNGVGIVTIRPEV
jgi:hypothetical protein